MNILRNACAIAVLLSAANQTLAAGLAGLYAAQPPAGSAYVRIVNASGAPLKVTIKGESIALAADATIASPYKIVDPTHADTIKINGVPISGEIKLQANGFTTLVIDSASNPAKAKMLLDSSTSQNALKAALRAYNLTPGCNMNLAVQNGPVVFDKLQPDENRVRLINPIKATLTARCEQGESASLTLPALNAGDKYSLFLIGSAAKPQLIGQIDQTEAYDK